MKTALCLGGNGFICHHMARRLRSEGYWVRVVDIKEYEYGSNDYADEIVIADLRIPEIMDAVCRLQNYQYSFLPKPFELIGEFDEIYQMGALMGGASFVFTGEHDADIMHDSALINMNVLNWCAENNFKGKLFYSSSACMYPQEIQGETNNTALKESDAYPLNPDSDYGLEKAFSERLFLAYNRNYGLNVRIARFHNIFGPEGTWTGGKEKAPAAMCRKVAEAKPKGPPHNAIIRDFDKYPCEVEIWGDGEQTRSFLYIDECIEGVRRLMQSDFTGPVNIGSDEIISINDLALMVAKIAEKEISLKHIEGPQGVRGRNSDNTLIFEKLGWRPSGSLYDGMVKTFHWINQQVNAI